MGCEEPDPRQELDRLYPGPGEARRAFHVSCRDAVHTREREARRSRPHQPSACDPGGISHNDNGECADAFRSIVRQLEVNRRERNIEGDAPHPVSLPCPTISCHRGNQV